MRVGLQIVGTAIGLFATLALTLLVFGLPVGPSLTALYEGALGDRFGVARTLVRACPLVLCGLGVVIAWKAKVYSIGGEGQYILGGIAGAFAAKLIVPASATLLASGAILVASAIGGALLAAFAGWLYIRRGVQVVISTILLNFLAVQFLEYVVDGPLQESSRRLPQTERLPDTVMMPRFDPQTDLHAGILLVPIAALLLWVLLSRTPLGFRIRTVGANAEAARVARMPVSRIQMAALAISGGLCGLAGGMDYVGFVGQIGPGFPSDWGFLAIPVALMGGLHPVGCLASGLFFGGLFAGSENLARFNTLGATVVVVMQALAMLGFVGITQWMKRRRGAV